MPGEPNPPPPPRPGSPKLLGRIRGTLQRAPLLNLVLALVNRELIQRVYTPGRKFRPTAHVGWHADSEGSRGVAQCRKVAFSLRLLAEKLIPRFENIVL